MSQKDSISMDAFTPDHAKVKSVIEKCARLRPSHGEIWLDTVFDDEQGHDALMQVGWDRGRRTRGNLNTQPLCLLKSIFLVLELASFLT